MAWQAPRTFSDPARHAPTQLNNVADRHPDVLQELSDGLLKWLKSLPEVTIEPEAGKADYRLLIVALAGFYFWGSKALECRRVADAAEEALKTCASESAGNTARAVSIFANRQIVTEDWAHLQDYADELVGGGAITYVAIVNPDGVAVVHTDRSSLGKEFVKPETPSVADASVPVMSLTEQVATVRVGVRYRQR